MDKLKKEIERSGEIIKRKGGCQFYKKELINRIEALRAKGITPKLGIIRVGARPDDLFYEKSTKKICSSLGIEFEIFTHPENISQLDFEKSLTEIGDNKEINGILMFAPLPKSLDEKKIRSLIPIEKDVDGMNLGSAGKVFADDLTGFPPCTPLPAWNYLNFMISPSKERKLLLWAVPYRQAHFYASAQGTRHGYHLSFQNRKSCGSLPGPIFW